MKSFIIRNIPDELHKALKIIAVQQGISLNALILAILKAYEQSNYKSL